MYSSQQERCAVELERFVAGVRNSKPDEWGIRSASVPWGRGGWCFTKDIIPNVIREIHAALAAKVWFSKHRPAWAQELPLGEECYPMLRGSGPPYLLGMYAFSLQLMHYDYLEHPMLYDFARGVMANPHTPAHIRDDPELQEEFPAKVLPGLSNRLIWFSPTELAGS